jgi:hypothetical protein
VAASFVGIAIFKMVRKNGMAHRVAYDVEQDMAENIVSMMEDAPPSWDDGAKGSAEERLRELRNLYDLRLITDEEYEAKRQEILREL